MKLRDFIQPEVRVGRGERVVNFDAVMANPTPGSLLDYVLRMDAAQCGKGWEGTKPGCTRAKSRGAATTKAEKQKRLAELEAGLDEEGRAALERLKQAMSGKENANESRAKRSISGGAGGAGGTSKGGASDASTSGKQAEKGKAAATGRAEFRDKPVKYNAAIEKEFVKWDKFEGGFARDFYKSEYREIRSLLEDLAIVPEQQKTFRGIADSRGNLQAAMTVVNRKDHVYIELLATAPWNIVGSDSRRVKGAGTAAIAAAVRESIARGHNGKVELSALEGAVGFYEKIGFKKKQNKGSLTGLPSMTLSAESAKAFLKKYAT